MATEKLAYQAVRQNSSDKQQDTDSQATKSKNPMLTHRVINNFNLLLNS
jgi:hypothetical protein